MAKRVLICCLNWGLGHASRCIPIIRRLKDLGCDVMLASDGRALDLLRKEFPRKKTFELPGYEIRYDRSNLIVQVLLQSPKMLRAIYLENQLVKNLVRANKIDVVISDHRYGCYSNDSYNVFITHQLHIKTDNAFTDRLANVVNQRFIRRFHECWVPDVEGMDGLAGELSWPAVIDNTRYLGVLSRFEPLEIPLQYDVMGIVSGPEPQRSYFERILLEQLHSLGKPAVMACGRSESKEKPVQDGNVLVLPFATAAKLNELVMASKTVVCRSGYSSIMDLVKVKKPAILVPTLGQTEQEYLADRMKDKPGFLCMDQKSFTLRQEFLDGLQDDFSWYQPHEQALEDALVSVASRKVKNGGPA